MSVFTEFGNINYLVNCFILKSIPPRKMPKAAVIIEGVEIGGSQGGV